METYLVSWKEPYGLEGEILRPMLRKFVSGHALADVILFAKGKIEGEVWQLIPSPLTTP